MWVLGDWKFHTMADILDSQEGLFEFSSEENAIQNNFPVSSAMNREKPWQVLIVDDEPAVHEATRFALGHSVFYGMKLQFTSAYSAREGLEKMKGLEDLALIFLDVVMESTDSGLGMVKVIREELGNHRVQIILRTGQPGDAPEAEVVQKYRINDYKLKTELTHEKLTTCVALALRSYDDLCLKDKYFAQLQTTNHQLKSLNHTLEEKVKLRTRELEAKTDALQLSHSHNLTLIRTLSHDLRNFCNAILLRCENALDFAEGQNQIDFQKISEQIDRMLSFIERVNTWDSLRTGKIKPKTEPVVLATLVEEAIGLFEHLAAEKKVRIHLEFNCNRNTVVHLERHTFGIIVLNNLISNALKFSNPGGQVTLKIYLRNENELNIEVLDQGIGIPPDLLADIFSFTKKTTRSGTNGEKGSGYGMPLVKEYMTAIGGDFFIESKEQNTANTLKYEVNQSQGYLLELGGTRAVVVLRF